METKSNKAGSNISEFKASTAMKIIAPTSSKVLYLGTKNKIIKNGFTFLEILIVVSITAILSSIVYVNINPLGRFEESRNRQRESDVFGLMQAIKLHKSEHNKQYLEQIKNLPKDLYYQIGTGSNCNEACNNPAIKLETSCIDLSDLATEGYISEIPVDPNGSGASELKTKYYLMLDSKGKLFIGSCAEENGLKPSPKQIEIRS